MDGEIRHKGCVPPCPYQMIPPSVSSFHDRPEALFLSGTPLRIIPSPSGLHKNSKILPYYPSEEADKHNGLSGRLDPLVSSQETLAANIATTINLSGELGFLINLEKSHTSPTQDIQWLGIQWSSRNPSVSLTCDFKPSSFWR